MIRINKDSELFDAVAGVFSTLAGIGASLLVNSLCDSIISVQDTGFFKTGLCKVGKYGLETITTCTVASTMRDSVDDLADFYNKGVDMFEAYQEQQNQKVFDKTISYEEN